MRNGAHSTPKNRPLLARSTRAGKLFGGGVASSVAALLLSPTPGVAQSVFTPLTPPPTDRSTANFFATNGLAAESILNAAAPPDPESGNQLRFGKFSGHPRLDYQYLNATGIRQSDKEVSTIQHLISPGGNVQMGRHWNLDVSHYFGFYTDKALGDTSGYNVALNGGIPYEEWVFGSSLNLSSAETTQVETARQTRQDTYDFGLSAIYGRERRVNVEFGIGQDIQINHTFNKSYSWSTLNWLNYVVTPKTTVGLGVGGGYDILQTGANSIVSTNAFSTNSSGTDSSYEQIQARVSWRPLRKLSFHASGGAQIEQFLTENGAKTVVNPIFAVSTGWSPTDGTSLTAGASRSVGNSILSDQYTEATSVGVEFSQRLLTHLRLSVAPSYNRTRFRSNTDPTGRADRTDEIRAIRVSLSTILFRRVNTSIFFSFTDNQSDDPNYAFESRQYGFQLGYRF